MSQFEIQKDCAAKKIDEIVKKIDEFNDLDLDEDYLQFFNEIFHSRITEAMNSKRIKKSKLDNAIFV